MSEALDTASAPVPASTEASGDSSALVQLLLLAVFCVVRLTAILWLLAQWNEGVPGKLRIRRAAR